MRGKAAALLSLIIVLCLCLSACASSDYKDAECLFEAGRYEEAIVAFDELGSYKDSEHKIDEVNYYRAEALLEEGNWLEAAQLAKKIVTDDNELNEQIDELLLWCELERAEELMLEDKIEQAIEICQGAKKATNSGVVVAADNLQRKCQEALFLEDVYELFEKAQTESENKNWRAVVALCEEIYETAPDTEAAAAATDLKTQAEEEIKEELSTLMTQMERAYEDNEWGAVVEATSTILDDYAEYLTDRGRIEKYKEEAAEKLQEEIAEKLEPALEKLSVEYDEVDKITWYMPNSKPQYVNDYCVSYLYIGHIEDEPPWLRWRTIYVDYEWMFFDKIVINVDGAVYSVNLGYNDVVRESNQRNYWEYADILPKASQLEMIRAIIDSENTVIRFANDDEDKTFDYTVSQGEKDSFRDVLEAYELMKYQK